MLIKRLISSVFLIALFTATLILSKSCILFFLAVVSILVGIAMYEVLSMVEKKGIPIFKKYVVFSGIILLLTIFFSVFKRAIPGDLPACALFILFVGLFLLYARKGDLSGSLLGILSSIGAVFYVSWFFSFLIRINYLESVDGRWYIFFVFLMVFCADIFAYVFGNLFGSRPLAPVISPKKTFEGSIGAFVGALIGALIGKLFFVQELAWHHVVVMGFLSGFVSQVGDLFESILKRDAGVKDSGHIIPGMGGVMDLIDGLLFSAPVLYLYLKVFVRL